jgi:hypothetical protein
MDLQFLTVVVVVIVISPARDRRVWRLCWQILVEVLDDVLESLLIGGRRGKRRRVW